MAPFSFGKLTSEREYVFEKSEIKHFAEKMAGVSGGNYIWHDFLVFAKEFKEFVDKYGPRDKDLHIGIFQTLDKIEDRYWKSAFNLLNHVLVHRGVSTSFWDNPDAYGWIGKFLKPEEIRDAIKDLRQKLEA